VTFAEINARGLLDVVDRIKIGETGYAYLADGTGRPIGNRAAPQTAVLSAHASVPASGWSVFVDLPVAEARVPLWSAVLRAALLLGIEIWAIFLASLPPLRHPPPA